MIKRVWENRGSFDKDEAVRVAREQNITPEFVAILLKRGLSIDSFLHPAKSVHDSHLLKDMEKGLEIVSKAISESKKICVVNDYDVDGATSGVIMKECINVCGGEAFILTPKRNVDGYGMSTRLVNLAKEQGAELIVTTDNGIAAFEAVSLAKELGLQVVVTDHHEVPIDSNGNEMLPPADAIIDPKRKESEYPFRDICGAEVAYKFAILLFDIFRIDSSKRESYLKRFTELAAIGTVCDVMPLVEENRALVLAGLELLKNSQIVGLRQLMKVQGINPQKLTSYNIGFGIGPCINAMSRIYDDTETVIALLEEKDHIKAEKLATRLKDANNERKADSDDGKSRAMSLINESDNIHIIYIPDSNPAVMGIVAGKVKETTGHPTICLTDAGDGLLKGSGRSTENYNMFHYFTLHKDLYEKFGGHEGAIGITFKKDNLEEIKRVINEDAKDLEFTLRTVVDLYMSMGYVNDAFVTNLSLLEPYGEGNGDVILCDEKCYLLGLSRMGNSKQYMRLSLRDITGHFREAVMFSNADMFDELISEKYGEDVLQKLYRKDTSIVPIELKLLYTPSFNYWGGSRSVSFNVKDFDLG